MNVKYAGDNTVAALIAKIIEQFASKSEIAALSGVTYLESTSDNPVYIRDLDSGTYIFYGKFKPFSGSTSTLTFSSKLVVNIVKGTSYSSMMVLYPVNNCIQYMKITDDASEKKYIYLNDLSDDVETLKASIGTLTELTTTEQSSLVAAINELSASAAKADLSNVADATFLSKATSAGVGIPIASAASADGIIYTATVPGVTELYNGLLITIIPDVVSASANIKLNVNGLGEKMVRLPLSFNNAAMASPKLATYYTQGRPITLQYDAEYLAGDGIWKVYGKQKTSAQDLYGTVPIESGGTGGTTAEDARANLGAAAASQSETLTVAADAWTGDAAPYTATIASTIATADNHLIVGMGGALTADEHAAMAAAMLVCTGQAAGSITLTAYGEKPGISLPVNVISVG